MAEFVPSCARWKDETAPYVDRMAKLRVATDDVFSQSERFPGLLSFVPAPQISVKHRGIIYANQLLGSAVEILASTQLLWTHGHFLCGGHCIRLLLEVQGALLFFQKKILERSLRSDDEARAADEKLQRLMLATNAPMKLPIDASELKVVNVNEFIAAGERERSDFQADYDFLCDLSHPTLLHMEMYRLRWDASWSNPIYVEEIHNVLERLARSSEFAVTGIASTYVEIYRKCIPDIEKAVKDHTN